MKAFFGWILFLIGLGAGCYFLFLLVESVFLYPSCKIQLCREFLSLMFFISFPNFLAFLMASLGLSMLEDKVPEKFKFIINSTTFCSFVAIFVLQIIPMT